MPLVWAYVGHGAGTQAVNGTGSLVIRAERVGRETMLSQIVRMVAEAQRSHVPLALTTPMSIMVGTGSGATAGVLVKNAEALELVEKRSWWTRPAR